MSWDDDEDTTQPCPYCGKAVYDDAVQCPSCGNYLVDDDSPTPRRPWWFVALAVVCLLLALGWVLRGW